MNIGTTKTLANGVEMPRVGYGVFRMKEYEEAFNGVVAALDAGYRSIDTAKIYENEEAVGAAIKASGVAREELFITTKVWNRDQGFDQTLRAFETSLKKLDLQYIDLYLTHWAVPESYVETYKAIERLYDEKLIRVPGVSNHQSHHLEELFKVANTQPMVNQIECHPSHSQDTLRAFCAQHDIAVTAWTPLGHGITFTHPVVRKLSKIYDKSPAQIVLRWHLDVGNIVIPKSVTPERIVENFTIFDFELKPDEVAAISALNTNHRTGPNPDRFYLPY